MKRLLKKEWKKDKKEYSNFNLNKIFLKKSGILKKGIKILEIGSANGSMTAWLQKQGCEVIGIEVDKKRLDYAKKTHKNCTFKYMNGEDLKFKDNYFDYVISFDVIEHIPNVKKHFKEVQRVLKPNGEYLFLTPNKIVNLIYKFLKALIIKRNLRNIKGGHVSLQTKKSLKKHFKKNKMKVQFIKLKEYQDYLKKILRFPLYYILNFIDIGIYGRAKKNGI